MYLCLKIPIAYFLPCMNLFAQWETIAHHDGTDIYTMDYINASCGWMAGLCGT